MAKQCFGEFYFIFMKVYDDYSLPSLIGIDRK